MIRGAVALRIGPRVDCVAKLNLFGRAADGRSHKMTCSAANLLLVSSSPEPSFMRQITSAQFLCTITTLVALLFSATAWGESAPFDLSGPNLEAKVTRGKTTLPISAVPNLEAGDGL